MSHYGGDRSFYSQRDAGTDLQRQRVDTKTALEYTRLSAPGRNWRDRELGGARGGATHLARIHGTEEDK